MSRIKFYGNSTLFMSWPSINSIIEGHGYAEAIIQNMWVFIFYFNRVILGERVTNFFKQKSREEMKFDSFEELKQQIAKDVEIGKQYFNSSSF